MNLKNYLNKNHFVLTKVKIFTLKDLWLFLIGIIFVSMSSGAIGAFIVGVSEEEFFLGGAPDVLIITEPGVSTPLTGKVPEYIQQDVQKVHGILAISPETIGFAIIQNLNYKSVIIRGITANFTFLTPLEIINGSWFDPIYGTSENVHTNGAMVGYKLAENLGFSCGDIVPIASTLTNVVVEIIITGIIRSDTPSDEEILVPLSIGKYMTGKGESYVSYIRVKVDEEIILTETLSELLNTEFIVKIELHSNDTKLKSELKSIPIIAYTPNGAYVETQIVQDDNIAEFNLIFGSYEFIATPSGVQNSVPLNIFLNQNFSNPFKLKVGESSYNLDLNVSYNKEPLFNVSVELLEKFSGLVYNSSQTDSNGNIRYQTVPEGFYELIVGYKSMRKRGPIRLNQSMYINVEMEGSLSLDVFNTTSEQFIDGGTVRIMNDITIIKENYHSSTPIYLEPGTYRVEYELGETIREIDNVFINGSVNCSILVGKKTFSVYTVGENRIKIESSNITISRDNKKVATALTNPEGFCDFQLEAGVSYEISAFLASNPSRNQTRYIFTGNSSHLTFIFVDSYQLNFFVFNRTLNSSLGNTGLENCNVTLRNNTVILSSKLTNALGQVTFFVSEADIYELWVEKAEYSWIGSVPIFNEVQSQNISLGDIFLIVSTISISDAPISDVEVSVRSGSVEIESGYTNSSGLVEIIFPIGEYNLTFNRGAFYLRNEISFRMGERSSFKQILELSRDLKMTIQNQFFQDIYKAHVILTNDYYGLEYSGFTDASGDIIFHDIPLGNYELNIFYEDYSLILQNIELLDETENLVIEVETQNPIISEEDYNLRRNARFSVVLSSKYVAGFIQSSLAIIVTTLTSLVIIISVISLLSIASVISYPIVSAERVFRTISNLGGTRIQIIIGVVIHLGIMSICASIIGSFLGMWAMTLLPQLKDVNIGGIIINPRINFWILIIIILSNLSVVVVKASQKANQLYKLQ